MSAQDIVTDQAEVNLPPVLDKSSLETAAQILNEVVDVPSAPPVAFKLVSMLRNPDQVNDEVVEIIKYDPNLTASILKVCNSAYYRASSDISSVEDAILRIGYHTLSQMVVTISMGKMYVKPKQASFINPYELWRTSLRTSFAARFLAKECKELETEPNLAFTVGILANMGKFALLHWPSPKMEAIYERLPEEELKEHELEFQEMGTDNAVLGSVLLNNWNIPEDICLATRFRHYPDLSPEPMAYLSHMAGICALLVEEDDPMAVANEYVSEDLIDKIGLKEEGLANVMKEMEKHSNEVQSYMMVVN
ncbi:MAG: HDOD domain-containing protein [Verrucomicrobiota bacterium]